MVRVNYAGTMQGWGNPGIEIHSNKFWVIMLFGGKYYFISKMGKTEISAEKFLKLKNQHLYEL